jgi:hypothetical protein|nr:MAG TPA: hypothetical protein [Caudoviricetes sp.]
MAEYSREQRNQLSRAVANSETGNRQMKNFIDNRKQIERSTQFKMIIKNTIQKADPFDSIDISSRPEKEGGPMQILRKKGSGPHYESSSVITSIQLRGGHSAAHSEVFCIIPLSEGKEGVLRFSRNQAGDTFQRDAEIEKSDWEIASTFPISISVSEAEYWAEKVHNRMPRYISGNCHDFADELLYALINKKLLSSDDDDFM